MLLTKYNDRPRVVLLEERGRLKGLVTVKDVLKYIAHTESMESSIPNGPSSRECSKLFDRLSLWVNNRSLHHRHRRQQSYTQLQNRSSLDIEESHELSRQS